MAVNVSLKDFNIAKINNRFTKSNKVGTRLAEITENKMEQYVPMRQGRLYQDTTIEPFKITYNQQYAKPMFYGTKFNFSKQKHPKAGARWDIAVKPQIPQIAKELSAEIEAGRLT